MDRLQRSLADDIHAITKQVYSYCRAMDRMDVELGYSVWHDDGEADYGEAIFRGTGHGFIDFVTNAHAAMIAHSHQVSNVLVEVDGDRAASESYVTAALRFEDDEGLKENIIRGRYLDRWSYRDGRWAVDRREFIHDFNDVRLIENEGQPSTSARDRSDRSYAVLDIGSRASPTRP